MCNGYPSSPFYLDLPTKVKFTGQCIPFDIRILNIKPLRIFHRLHKPRVVIDNVPDESRKYSKNVITVREQRNSKSRV